LKVAYIAGPYRGETESAVVANIRHAEKYAIKYWQMGYAVICPHMNSALLGGVVPNEAFLRGDLEILRRCDVVVMIPGWLRSAGAVGEELYARRLGLEIIYPTLSEIVDHERETHT